MNNRKNRGAVENYVLSLSLIYPVKRFFKTITINVLDGLTGWMPGRDARGQSLTFLVLEML